MTVGTNINQTPLLGDGVSQTFTFSFECGKNGATITPFEVFVYLQDPVTGVETKYSYPTDFNVTFAISGSGGTITFTSITPALNQNGVISRELTFLQPTQFNLAVNLDERAIEKSLDRETMQQQELLQRLNGTVRLPVVAPANFDPTLPATLTPGRSYKVNAAGNGFDETTFDPDQNAAAAAASAAAAAGSASGAATSAGSASTSATNAAASAAAAAAAVGTVKVTTNDTTPGVLNTKLLVSGNITKTVGSPGGNETLTLTVNVTSPQVQDFRLTLTSGLPVTVSDVIGTTIYCCPYKGNRIALYDGTNWNIRTSAQFSLALGTVTAQLPYDVFCYDNAGVPTLEFTAWTNATTRATVLVYQDGVLVKSGALTRRYLGTFCPTNTTQVADGATQFYGRQVWNYYNRIPRIMYFQDAAADHTYTTATWRQWGGTTSGPVFVVGVSEDEIRADILAFARNTSANVPMWVAFGLDSITSPATSATTDVSGIAATVSYVANNNIPLTNTRRFTPSAGRHLLSLLQQSGATGTTTWVSGSMLTATIMA